MKLRIEMLGNLGFYIRWVKKNRTPRSHGARWSGAASGAYTFHLSLGFQDQNGQVHMLDLNNVVDEKFEAFAPIIYALSYSERWLNKAE